MRHIPVIAVTASVLIISLAGSGMAADSKIKVTKNDCKNVVRHLPSADVQYKPGVDVYGRKVASADLNGPSQIKIPDEITIAFGVDLAEKFGLGASGKYMSESAPIGKVTVRGGQVYWNGQRLGGGEQHAIAEACKKIYAK